MKRAAKAAGLPAECVPHGLRNAQMRRLAEGLLPPNRLPRSRATELE
jgi:hypothetical protein